MSVTIPSIPTRPADATDEKAAPGDLELVRAFVNTVDLETETDDLSSPDALGQWLVDRGLAAGNLSLGEADLRRAIEFREALRNALLANNGGTLDPAAVAALDRAAGSAPVTIRFLGGRAGLEPLGSGLDSAIARLAVIVFEAMEDGRWPRLKACPADDCHWAFYDRSRNRSGTWCEMAVCGNRAKVRAYRVRSAEPRVTS